jgi:hypothetical protein
VRFLPIQFSYKITSGGKILPAKSWIVSKGNSGQLISFLHNREKGVIDNYSVKEFERGDDIHLLLNEDFKIGETINEKDTVGFIYSNEIEKELALLQSELNVAKSSLDFNLSGEKESVIREAEENLKFYTSQAEVHNKILSRQKALREKNLLSQEEFELTLNQAELNDISIAIAKARLESVSTGAKKEQIELINNQIQSLEKQIGVLQKRYTSYYLISPIDGVVSNLTSGDTLFTISDNDEFIVMIPVKISEIEFIKNDSKVEVKHPLSAESRSGKIILIDYSTHNLSGEQVIFAIAIVENGDQTESPDHKRLASGLMVECKIDGGSAGLYEHLKRFMNKNIF